MECADKNCVQQHPKRYTRAARGASVSQLLAARNVRNPEAVARAVGEKIIRADDAETYFAAPKSDELATGKDYIELAFKLGQLSHSVDWFAACLKVARENGATPEDLAHTAPQPRAFCDIQA